MARYGATLTVQAGKMPSGESNFAWVATADNFPAAAIDGGTTSILNGGGNLRCYTDDTKATQIPIEVVVFVTGGSPSIQVWGLSPTLNVASTIYIEADAVATNQPAVSAAFGRDATWVNYEAVIHANETGTNGVFVDSTGNGHDTSLTTGSTLITTTSGNPFGLSWPDFSSSEVLSLTNSYDLINNSPFTISCWVDADITSDGSGLFGSRYDSPDSNWAQFNTTGRIITKAGVSENVASGSISSVTLLKAKQDSSSLDLLFNSSLISQDSSVVDGESINNTAIGNNFRIGTYFNNAGSRRFNGRASEFKIKRSKDNASYDVSEYNNQSSPSTFWNAGTWDDQDAGGGVTVTVVEQGPSFTESIASSLSPLPITVSLAESGPLFTESISATVTSTLSINATLAEQGPVFTDSIGASLGVNLSSAINELGPSFTDSITVNLTTSISGSISESGPSFIESIIASIPVVITVNPKNIIRVKRKSNTVTIKRKSNIVRVR